MTDLVQRWPRIIRPDDALLSSRDTFESGGAMVDEGVYTGQSEAMERKSREWAMYLHLSVLLGSVALIIGLAAPIVIWQIKKDEMPIIDVHGKIVVNWIISLMIYIAIGFVLLFVLIGIPILIALWAMSVIFPIIGGIKASKGEVWKYPFSLQIIK